MITLCRSFSARQFVNVPVNKEASRKFSGAGRRSPGSDYVAVCGAAAKFYCRIAITLSHFDKADSSRSPVHSGEYARELEDASR